jgi:ribosomal protein RSM22 (predicted rRNA methylase)
LADDLPGHLQAAIAAMLTGVSRKDLAVRAARLSDGYRAGDGSAAAISGPADVLAYLVTRLPATYAATSAVFRHLRLAAPEFSPLSLLDVGAGPGTAGFAAVAAWPGIAAVTMIDRSRHFINAAGDLAAHSGHGALAGGTRILADATRFGRELPGADLVVAGYTLAEILDADAGALVAALWKACHGALVIVEPGTPAGFQRIREARAALIAGGAAIAAPCPHALACPIVTPDWCHFSARLSRSRDHRLAKAADLAFEDEKFAYVVAVRPTVGIAPYGARILALPRSSKAETRLKLCRQDGTIGERVVPRRDRSAHATVRRARWGDAVGGEPGQSGSDGPELV